MKAKLLLRDEIPPVLYRYLKEREHVDQFLSGVVRMGHLQHYAKIDDDARSDELEGRGEFSFHGVVRSVTFPTAGGEPRELPPKRGLMSVSSEDLTPNYICCFSTRLDAMLAAKWGTFIIRLIEPRSFIDELSLAAETCKDLFGPLECGKISYDSAPVLAAEPTNEDLKTQACFTKASKYADEFEFRLLHRLWLDLGSPGNDPDPPTAIHLTLKNRTKAMELISI